mgnify:CR=1 FL=1
MSKLRVHELARELGRQNREVIEFLKSKGVDVRSHMSMVDEPAVSEVKNRFRKDNNNRGKEHIAKLETPKTEEKVVTAKSEGELIITGTKGYIYVPAPWWKTDYFEVRYENPEDNQRFFYQLDGEGIRYEIVAFAKSVEVKKPMNYVEKGVSKSIAKIIESFNDRTDMIVI